jgi:Protein of unknown function (DUF3592)
MTAGGASGKGVVIGVGAVFAAIGLLFAAIGAWMHFAETGEQRRLDAAGRFTDAVVVRRFIRADATGGRAEPSFRLQVRFTPEVGDEVTASAAVDMASYDRALPGSPIGVTYLPDAPSVHRVDGEVRDRVAAVVFAAIGIVFAIVGGGMIFAMLRRPRPEGAPPGLLAQVGALVMRAPLMLFGAVWLLVGVALLFAGLAAARSERATEALFARDALPAEGIVAAKSIVTESSGSGSSRRRTTKYRVTLRFTAASGDEVVGIADVGSSTWDSLVEQGPVAVTYVASRPWLYRVAGEGTGWSASIGTYILFGFGAVATALGGGVLAYALRHAPKWPRRATVRRRVARRRRAKGEAATAVPQVRRRSLAPKLASAAERVPRRSPVQWVAAIFFAAGVAAAGAGISTLVTEWRYAVAGEVAEGVITAKSIEEARRSERSSTRHMVSYRFTTARGQVTEGRHRLSWEAWESGKEGDRILVRYRQDAPHTNRAATADETVEGFVTLALGIAFGGLGGGALALALYARRRRARLMRDGLSVTGVVVAVEPSGVRVNKVPQMRIRFRFRDPAGRERQGASQTMPPGEASRWKPGDTGEVRFDALNPDDNVWIGERHAHGA